MPVINFFLQQKINEVISYDQSIAQLQEIIAAAHAHNQQPAN
jgi:flagellum-specific ATP synthase